MPAHAAPSVIPFPPRLLPASAATIATDTLPAPAEAPREVAPPATHASRADAGTTVPASPAPDRHPHTLGAWAFAVALLLGAAWAVRRQHRLARETRRLARQHRALKSINSRLQSESEQLRQQAINDPLTGALNRHAFAASLRELLQQAARYHRPVALIILDLDHFKAINDRFGHLAGDSALKLVTGIVHEHLVSADLFGRFGGDEFLIACADRDPEAAMRLADAIRADVAAAAPSHVPALPGLTLSMGLVQADVHAPHSADDLFARADAALYEAKRRGRNRVVVADDVLQASEPLTAGRHL